jgi:hypothetical protein
MNPNKRAKHQCNGRFTGISRSLHLFGSFLALTLYKPKAAAVLLVVRACTKFDVEFGSDWHTDAADRLRRNGTGQTCAKKILHGV